MADYFARVELHGAHWPTGYEKLHVALAQHGFKNSVPASDGKLHRLPTALYYSTNRIDDVSKVETAVKDCANSTGYESEVVVIKDGGWQAHFTKG